MDRKIFAIAVAVMLSIVGLSAWHDLSGRDQDMPEVYPTDAKSDPSAQPTSTVEPKSPTSDQPDQALVERNRNERTGPSWSPADPVGEDGQLLTMGDIVPGAIEPVRVGMGIQEAVNTGLIEPDPQRAESCEGTFWKWKGQLSGGLDILVGEDKHVAALGMSKDGLETPEGISIGNSFGALTGTYGDRLEGPVRLDYGNAGAFLRDGANWIGFGMDNQPGQLADDSRIAFIEVTRGNRPGLVRDGC